MQKKSKINYELVPGVYLDTESPEVVSGKNRTKLTPIEYQCLMVLVTNKGSTVSYQALGLAGWNDTRVNVGTIKVHVCSIKKKLSFLKKKLRVRKGQGYFLELR